MKKTIYILIYFVFISKVDFGQSVNMIIQVNEKLKYEDFGSIYLTFGSNNDSKRYPAGYMPGRLTIDKDAWDILEADSSVKCTLHLDYYAYKNNAQNVTNFYVNLNLRLLVQPYLVLNIYDFRDKKYKSWYQWHTYQNFLAEFRFPNSGHYIRKVN